MAKTTSVPLDDNSAQFVDDQVSSGRYASAGDVVREALELMQEREIKLQALRQALQEGLDSGEPEPFDFDDFLAEMHAEDERNA